MNTSSTPEGGYNILEEAARRVRRRVLSALWKSKASHLGTSLSVVDILVSIYGSIDTGAVQSKSKVRDRVILSKGHGAAALYCVLEEFNLLSSQLVDSYHQSGSLLTGHVSHKVPGVEHSTGALGHGLSVAIGMAIGLRNRGSNSKVFCVVGDGEIQEGSVWEAVMLWKHLDLRNLILFVDDNKISSIDQTFKAIDMRPLDRRFDGFGINALNVDGHNYAEIVGAIQQSEEAASPTVLICSTVKGKGATFAEGQPIWHYRTLDDEHHRIGLNDLGGV
jgi:transketolase